MSEGIIVWYHPLWFELQKELKTNHPHYWNHLQHNPMSEAGFFYWMNLQLDLTMSGADVTMEEALKVWMMKLKQRRHQSIIYIPPGAKTA